MRKLAVLFAAFVIVAIALADLGYLHGALVFVNSVPLLDKLLHFLLMGILTFLVVAALVENFPLRRPTWIIWSVVLSLLAIFTVEEFSQIPIPGRDASLFDLGANYAGILFFGFMAWLRFRQKNGS